MIEVRHLTKHYGATLAVDDLSFTVAPGRVTGFLGPNGAGKSTTMRMVLDLDRPDSGDVRVDGVRYRDLREPLRSVGALLDARWVHPNRSARMHLRWLARTCSLPSGRADQVLGVVGLAAVADRRVGTFSLGMRQRLGIAAALLGEPQTLVFDEPVNGLDPEGIAWFRQLVHGLADEGRAILVSSHLLSEMALTAQDVIVIGRGRLIVQTTMDAVLAGSAQPTVRVRSPQADQLARLLTTAGAIAVADQSGTDGLVVTRISVERVGELAAANGVVLHELGVQQGSLERAFMQLTADDVEYATGDVPVTHGAMP